MDLSTKDCTAGNLQIAVTYTFGTYLNGNCHQNVKVALISSW